MRKPNDVGAAWVKTNEYGEYLSISLDLDVLLGLMGGMTNKVNLNAYPIVTDKPNAPAWQLKYYPPRTGAGADARPAQPAVAPRAAPRPAPRQYVPPADSDDDIPF